VDDEDVRREWLSTLADAGIDAAVRPAVLALRDTAVGRHGLGVAA
jgi:hypothetical protein